MAKYKIIPSSRTIAQSPISIGHKAEKGVEAIEFDLTAWVETYGSGTLTVIMRRWGDAIPYPIALEIDENNKATWTLSDIDTAKAGMAYAQLSYIVGDEVVKKSDIYTFRVMDSLTGEGEPPEAYESWLEHLTHIAAEAMAEVLDIEGIVTDKTLTVDGGIADAKATGDALSALEDQFSEETDQLKADLDAIEPGLSDDAKTALLACFDHVMWAGGDGDTYLTALREALANNPFEDATYGYGSFGYNWNAQSNVGCLKPNDSLLTRAKTPTPVRCTHGSFIAKSGYVVTIRCLKSTAYGSVELPGAGTITGYYDLVDVNPSSFGTTVLEGTEYVLVVCTKSDTTQQFTQTEIDNCYGTVFEYREVSA